MSDKRLGIGFAIVTASAAVSAVVASYGLGWSIAVPDGSTPGTASEAPAIAAADPEAAARAPRTARRSESQYREAILGRNIFDQSKVGVKDEPKGEGKGDDGPTLADLNAELKGTLVADPAETSTAFIVVDGESTAYAYSVGQQVLGATLVEVQRDRVKLLLNGQEQWLVMGEEGKKSASTPAAASGPDNGEDVEQISETEFVVDRDMLEENLNDLEGLSRMGRALLHRGPDGNFDGYRLSAIRRGSLPDKLGIRNGDIVHSVNGLELDSVGGAMQALQSLQDESSLKFEVTRRGKPVELSYQVR